MEISTIIIIATLILTMPIPWLEVNAYKNVIKKWRELEPNTYQDAGSPSEYLELSNLRIKYTYILSFDYLRKISNSEVKSFFKKHHILFFSEHLIILVIVLCSIYC